ncbi:hypothetical protein [Streptosporangium sp. NPDC087985]|uniref:hypothetical protein n=1 Tax=Streptosporangium sp. NPDC087985 TaxID=3366196 RepID=UPI0037F9619F
MSLLDQITARLVTLTEHAERLRTQLAEAEDDLDRLRVAEQVVKEILAEHSAAQEETIRPGQEPAEEPVDESVPVHRVALTAARAAELLPGSRLIPFRHEATGVHTLPADYQALLSAVRAGDGPLPCKTICEQLGLSTEPGQVEGVRAKLKRLVERGWLRKSPSGAFLPLG